MKNLLTILFVFLWGLCLTAQNVGIGTNAPDASAKLHIESDSTGLLMPRLTTTQRSNVSNPTNGLMVYDTDFDRFFYWNKSLNAGLGDWSALPVKADTTVSDIGTVAAFPGDTYPNDVYLPLSGGTYNKADYPKFYDMIASLSANVVTSTPTTFTLANWNSESIFLRGKGAGTAGTLQNDATALPNTGFTGTTSNGGSHSHSTQIFYGGQLWSHTHTGSGHFTSADGSQPGTWVQDWATNSAGDHTHTVAVNGGGDTETRPVNRSVTWVIRVKPSAAYIGSMTVNNNNNIITQEDADWYKANTSVSPTLISESVWTNGNVGIGTTNPSTKLDVVGDIKAENLKADTVEANYIIADNIWTQVAQVDVTGVNNAVITGLDGNADNVYRIEFQGSNNGGGADRRFLIQANSISSAVYKGFAEARGDHSDRYDEDNGFYVGRTGWGSNTDFSFTYTIAARTGKNRTGYGKSTFYHLSNNNLLAFSNMHSVWKDTATNITSLRIISEGGGTFSGRIIVYVAR